LGLLAGFAARFALKDRHPLIRGLASAAGSIVGLAILGALTNWKSGIGPFGVGMTTVHWLDAAHLTLRLPLGFHQSSMDLLDLVHAVIAMDASWIALRVWRQSGPLTSQAPLPVPQVPRSRRPARPLPAARASQEIPSVPARRVPAASVVSNTRSRGRRKKAERAVIGRPALAIRPGRSKSKRLGGSRRSHPAVHLAVHEEHRCPYCLEPVNRNDSRGVVECQICHTLHHKDCWDITGNCQVPHLTTL
jgi:ribosomal protein L37AE/L43A